MLITSKCPCWQNLLKEELCSDCLKSIQQSLIPRSVSYELEDLKLLSMSSYSSRMRDFIINCKSASFNGLMPSQKKLLQELCCFWSEELRLKKIDALVPIPAHPWRSLLQSDLAWFLARYLSYNLGLGEQNSLLKRRIYVKGNVYRSQKASTAFDRRGKISEQYYVPKIKSSDRRVFLVDDVCTTGATLKCCQKILEDAGYEVCGAIVLSRVIENKKTGTPFKESRYL